MHHFMHMTLAVFVISITNACGTNHQGAGTARGPRNYEAVSGCQTCGQTGAGNGNRCPFSQLALTAHVDESKTNHANQRLIAQISIAGCAACVEQMALLKEFAPEYPGVVVNDFEDISADVGGSFPKLIIIDKGRVRDDLTPKDGKQDRSVLENLFSAP